MSSAQMGIKDKIKTALVFMDFTLNRLPVHIYLIGFFGYSSR